MKKRKDGAFIAQPDGYIAPWITLDWLVYVKGGRHGISAL